MLDIGNCDTILLTNVSAGSKESALKNRRRDRREEDQRGDWEPGCGQAKGLLTSLLGREALQEPGRRRGGHQRGVGGAGCSSRGARPSARRARPIPERSAAILRPCSLNSA